jgi:hypothetical protein
MLTFNQHICRIIKSSALRMVFMLYLYGMLINYDNLFFKITRHFLNIQ